MQCVHVLFLCSCHSFNNTVFRSSCRPARARSGRTDADQWAEEVHGRHPLQPPGLRLRLGELRRCGGAAELCLDGSCAAVTSEQRGVLGQRADGGPGLRSQHLPGGRQRNERWNAAPPLWLSAVVCTIAGCDASCPSSIHPPLIICCRCSCVVEESPPSQIRIAFLPDDLRGDDDSYRAAFGVTGLLNQPLIYHCYAFIPPSPLLSLVIIISLKPDDTSTLNGAWN